MYAGDRSAVVVPFKGSVPDFSAPKILKLLLMSFLRFSVAAFPALKALFFILPGFEKTVNPFEQLGGAEKQFHEKGRGRTCFHFFMEREIHFQNKTE